MIATVNFILLLIIRKGMEWLIDDFLNYLIRDILYIYVFFSKSKRECDSTKVKWQCFCSLNFVYYNNLSKVPRHFEDFLIWPRRFRVTFQYSLDNFKWHYPLRNTWKCRRWSQNLYVCATIRNLFQFIIYYMLCNLKTGVSDSTL